MSLSEDIKKEALRLGFDLVGITSADPHPHVSFFKDWLAHQHHASMAYLANNQDKRADPHLVLQEAKTFICCGLNYYHGYPRSVDCKDPARGWISNYAWGDDYHDVVLKKLKQLESFIKTHVPEAKTKSYVDTGPILERSYAASAGLGWIGKNTLLINRKVGSYFFIGEILTNLDLETDSPVPDHCGTCTRCLDACPTHALVPGKLDANKCISYLTIEHRGDIDPGLSIQMKNNLVGCDICQDVCPWNREPPLSTELSFKPREGNFHPALEDIDKISSEDFSSRFKGSPIKRVKWEGLKRNAEIARKSGKGG